MCTLTPPNCNQCAQAVCQKIGSSPQPSSGSSSNQGHKSGGSAAGPIAGGVIGGIAIIILATFLVWRFCIRNRRKEYDPRTSWPEVDSGMEKSRDGFASRADARASTHTVGSIASTVLTRASNIIQIAYIPGVTNRSVESSPDLLVPPVPPIPAASPSHSTVGTPQNEDQHFFMPSDLRDSRFSDYTVNDRASYARSSMTPSMARTSVATTAYRSNAVVNPVPAQTIMRGKATAVSLRSSGKNSPVASPRSPTPPVPTINFDRHATLHENTQSPIVARTGTPKAVTVTKSRSNNNINAGIVTNPSPSLSQASQKAASAPERNTSRASTRHDGTSSTFDDPSSDEEVESPDERSLMGHDRQPQFATRLGSSAPKETPFRSGQPFSGNRAKTETQKIRKFEPDHRRSDEAGQQGAKAWRIRECGEYHELSEGRTLLRRARRGDALTCIIQLF